MVVVPLNKLSVYKQAVTYQMEVIIGNKHVRQRRMLVYIAPALGNGHHLHARILRCLQTRDAVLKHEALAWIYPHELRCLNKTVRGRFVISAVLCANIDSDNISAAISSRLGNIREVTSEIPYSVTPMS